MTDNLEMMIEVRGLAHGQPRSYADRQDIYEVTVRTLHYVNSKARAWERVLDIETHPLMLEQIVRGAVRAPKGLGRSSERPFDSYTDYVHHVAQDGTELVDAPEFSDTGTVRIRIVEPFTD